MMPRTATQFARLSLVLVAIAGGCSGGGDPAGSPVTIGFDADEVGGPPRGFAADLTGGGGPVSWVVRADATAPTGAKVLVQESADETSYRFPLCIFQDKAVRDGAVEVKFKAIAGQVDQAAGIVLRHSPENYYVARANALEDNVNLFKTENGKRVKIEEVSARVTPGEWHTLRFEARGQHLLVALDGKTVIERDDATFPGPGQVGLWTKADSVSAFDDLKIEPAR